MLKSCGISVRTDNIWTVFISSAVSVGNHSVKNSLPKTTIPAIGIEQIKPHILAAKPVSFKKSVLDCVE